MDFHKGFKSNFISDFEIEEFRKILKNNNFQEKDFEFFPKENKQNKFDSSEDFETLTGTVSVIFRPTGKQRVYKAGHGNKWTFEFQKDLNRGFFQ